jgi:hypothetical protein
MEAARAIVLRPGIPIAAVGHLDDDVVAPPERQREQIEIWVIDEEEILLTSPLEDDPLSLPNQDQPPVVRLEGELLAVRSR